MAPKRKRSASEWKQAGNESFKHGQYGQAAGYYTEAIKIFEKSGLKNPEEQSILFSNRAACYLKDGICSECIKDCSSALDLIPFGIKPLLRRAAAYEALERYQLAYVDYKTVLQVDFNLQAAHDGVNRMAKALIEKDGTEWRKKLPLIPSVPLSNQTRWEMTPEYNLTDTDTKKNIPLREQNGVLPLHKVPTEGEIQRAKALKEEGNEWVKKKNYREAIDKYSESLKFNNQESATYTNRALCYLSLNQHQEAVKDCTEALKLDTKNVKAFYRRALALKELKDFASSLADLKQLLEVEPDNTAVQKLFQDVQKLMK
uniref:Mitochondrial import receptor subunit TOM34 n=1 Tax=Geotrypetes seraphini TaxID=260995 RepID=A0A6P8SX54_GEOSA|nr:mitochondrial import receptor subunit TOM34 [Geotrypetes seraphini]XP_033818882.1 mitochondrial import receptor subunit TOM34 [Geotrypetes seraphini]XP_033818883.1 mitochondrial import receptor subunit TOM34 [Geotrypetes seraphini]